MSVRHPQLAAIARDLEALSARVAQCQALEEGAFRRRPSAHSWSAAECVGHLTLTTTAFIPLFGEALRTPDRHVVDVTHRYRRDIAGWLLSWMLEPPFRIKVSTPRPFVPVDVGSRGEVLARFAERQDDLRQCVAACDLRDLERLKIPSPFDSRFSYNLYSALTILVAHERRHLWQAERALSCGADHPGGQ